MKSFWGEIKSIFHHFSRVFNEGNKTNFFGKWDSDFKNVFHDKLFSNIINVNIFVNREIALYDLLHKRYKKMSSISESDFETNSFEKDKSDEFPSETELSDS